MEFYKILERSFPWHREKLIWMDRMDHCMYLQVSLWNGVINTTTLKNDIGHLPFKYKQ